MQDTRGKYAMMTEWFTVKEGKGGQGDVFPKLHLVEGKSYTFHYMVARETKMG
jgi:hypothetical protein